MCCRTTRAESEIKSVPLGKSCGRSPSAAHLQSSLPARDCWGRLRPVPAWHRCDSWISTSLHLFIVFTENKACFVCWVKVSNPSWQKGAGGAAWQGREGHPGEVAVSDWNLEMWSTQLVCPSLSCCGGTDWPGRGKQQVVFWSALSLLLWWDWWKLELTFPFHWHFKKNI